MIGEFKFGRLTYTVKFDDEGKLECDGEDWNYGRLYMKDNTILINKNCNPESYLETFLHEVVHACLNPAYVSQAKTGKIDSEFVCELVSIGFAQLLTDQNFKKIIQKLR